jgi:hypothetical protein
LNWALLTVDALIDSGTLPLLVKVTLCGAELAPMATAPKSISSGNEQA